MGKGEGPFAVNCYLRKYFGWINLDIHGVHTGEDDHLFNGLGWSPCACMYSASSNASTEIEILH